MPCGLILGLTIFVIFLPPASAQTIPVPESIHAEGVPPIPASLSAALNRYQNIRMASFQDWGSKGREMYITTRFADTPQVHHVVAPAGSRWQLTFSPERVLNALTRPKHNQILFTMDAGGAENYQLFLMDRTGGEPRRITDGKSRNTSPAWSPSGELLAWSSNARNGRDMDLYLASPLDPHFLRRLKEVSGQWTVADWSPDESKVVALEYLSIVESYMHVIEIATGQTRTITPRRADSKAEPVAASDPKWSKDGKSIYFITDKESDFRRLVRHDLSSGAEKVLTASIASDIEEYDLSDDGQIIALITNQEGYDDLRVFQAASGKEIPVNPPAPLAFPDETPQSRLPRARMSGLKFRPGSHELGLTHGSSRDVSDAYSLELSGGSFERWTWSETGGLDVSTFPEPSLVKYQSFDGRQISALVYRPPQSRFPGRRPVLIDIHGGPEGQSRPGFLGRLNYLTGELGITLIFPNVRGSTGYGKAFMKLDDGMLREGAVKDIGALLDWIDQQPDLDKSRVGVIGGSYGGFMSLAVQTAYNDRIKAGIDIVGISNFVSFLKNTQSYRRDLRRAEYGDERDPKMREFLERISPLSSVSKIHTPILIVQGQNDPRVPLSEAQQILTAVRKNGVPVWYVVGKNEGHGFAKKANQDYLQAVEVLFLRRYLLGEGS